MTVFLVALAIVLVILGGVYAASEAAIGTAPTALIAELAKENGRASLSRIAADPARHIAASSFLRVICETAAAASIAILFDRLLSQWWLALLLTVAIMLVVSFVLVGSSPRGLGRNHPIRVLRWTSGIVAFAAWSIGPVGAGLSRIGGRVAAGGSGSGIASEAYLLNLVDKATESDVLDDDERDLIHQVVEFGDTIIREVMVPRTDMVAIESDATVGEAMGTFLSRGVSRVPVIGEDVDEVLGVLYLRDAAKELYERGDDAADSAASELAKPPLFVPESLPVDDAMRLMQAESMHILMVIDEYGGVAGLATMEDVIEELLGAISDESDREADEVDDLGDGRFRVSARLGLDELGEIFGIDIEDEDVDSAGGLFQKAYGKLAMASAQVSVAGLDMTAESVDAQSGRILSLLVTFAGHNRADSQDAADVVVNELDGDRDGSSAQATSVAPAAEQGATDATQVASSNDSHDPHDQQK